MGVLTFGAYQLKLPAGELRKHGVPLRLSGHSLSILRILLEKPGELVTREEIQKRLWPADTFVDFEHGLNTAMKKLRAVLGDTAEEPRFIETVPRLGYRFIAPIEAVAAAVGLAGAATDRRQEGISSSWTRPRDEVATLTAATSMGRWRWLGVAVAALLLAILLQKLLVTSLPMPHAVSVQRLTRTSKIDIYGELHTDGARLFFLSRRGSKWDLMQMPMAGGEPQPFSSPFENTRLMGVSPDGSLLIVAPFERRDPFLPLYIMSSVGGTPRRLGDAVASSAAFTPDGQRVTFATKDGIYEVQLDGLKQRNVVSIEGNKQDLEWSPDGKRLRFTLGNRDGNGAADRTEVWETAADGGGPHPVLPGWDAHPLQCCGRWTRDGRYFLYVSENHDGSPKIWALAEPKHRWFGGQLKPALVASGAATFDGLLPGRGHQVYALVMEHGMEYVLWDVRTGLTRGLLGGASAAWLGFTNDGRWTVSRRDDGAIWRSHPDGSEAVEVAAASLHPVSPSITADGSEVFFGGDGDGMGMSRIYSVPSSGGVSRVLVADVAPLGLPSQSPDQTELVYSSEGTANSPSRIHVLERATGKTSPIPGSEGMYNSRWSPNGKYLAATSEDLSRIAVFDLEKRQWRDIAKGKVFSAPIWSSDSRSLYFQDILEEGELVHQVSAAGHAIRAFDPCSALLSGNVLRCGFEDIAPDGSFVLQLTHTDHALFSLELSLP